MIPLIYLNMKFISYHFCTIYIIKSLGFSLGCEKCGCNTDYAVGSGCNQETGQCTCLDGVVGQNCDRCPKDWVLVVNETRTGVLVSI